LIDLLTSQVSAVDQAQILETLTWLDYARSFAPAISTLLIGVVATGIALHTVKENRRLSKERLSVEHLMNRSRDNNWVRCYRLLSALHVEPTIDVRAIAIVGSKIDFSKIQDGFEKPVTHRRCSMSLVYMLNQLEYMAIAIKENVLDEDILYSSSRTSTITIFKIAKVYIEEVRSRHVATLGRSSAYEEIECLVKSWERKISETNK
jgi:hypothetical protein